jgi:hypothetical protein
VDLTFSKNPMDDFYKIPDVLLQSEETDILLAYFLSPGIFIERMMRNMGLPPEQIKEEAARTIAQLAETFLTLTTRHRKPIVGFTYRSLQEQMVRTLLDRGIPIFQDPERAARAIAAVLRYYRIRDAMGADATSEVRAG